MTLLPRHWEWLALQPGGASVALRKLVESARRGNREADERRARRDAAYQFMSSVGGDLPGFEEASRALFANDSRRLRECVAPWPADIRDRAIALAVAVAGDIALAHDSALPGDSVLAGGDPALVGPNALDESRANEPSPAPDELGGFATPAQRNRFSALDDVLPPDQRTVAHRVLTAAFGNAAIDAAVHLPSGAAGPATVIRIDVNDAPYLLRLEGPPSPLRDAARHYACLKIASDAGIAPRLLHADADSRIAITEFVCATPPSDAAPRSVRLQALARSVRKLHAAPAFPRYKHYLDCIDSLLDQFQSTRIIPSELLREHLKLYRELTSAYPRRDRDLVSSHNDLNPSNVLFVGERPWVVDWESAFAADRYVDIAAVANFFAADDEDENVLLRSYFGPRLNDDHRARFFLMQQANRMFYAMVLLNAVAAAKPQTRLTAANLATPRFREVRADLASLATHEGRQRFGCVFLTEMLVHLMSERFAQSIACLRT